MTMMMMLPMTMMLNRMVGMTVMMMMSNKGFLDTELQVVNWRNTSPSPLPHVLCFVQRDNVLYNIHRQKYLPLIVNQFRGVCAILKSTMHYLVVPESNRAGGARDVSVRLLIQFPTDFF